MEENEYFTSRRDKDLFNNTKAIKALPKATLDQELTVYENGPKHPNEYLMMMLTSADVELLHTKLSRFDVAIMDSIYTMYINGQHSFTVESLAAELGKKEVAFPVSSSSGGPDDLFNYESLRNAIMRLKAITVQLNCGSLKAANGSDIFDDVVVDGFLLPVESIMYTTRANKKRKAKFVIFKKPVLYEYAEKLGRVLSVPSRMLEIEGVRNTQENIVLKQEIAKTITLMRNPRNNYTTRDITYYRLDNNGNEAGLLARIGVYKENYKEASWKNKIRKIHHIVGLILHQFKEEQYILDFEENRNRSVTGYHIYL